MKVCVLASGSSGNMVWLSAGDTAILVDAGLSSREAFRRMHRVGLEPEGVRAVLVTHEHADHSKGAEVLSRRLRIPVYMSDGTAAAWQAMGNGGPRGFFRMETFQTGRSFTIGPFLVEPFPTPHDAADSCGFVIWHRAIKSVVVTDLGHLPMLVRQKMVGARILVLESNHDVQMLLNGSYPWWLKQRILGRHGHLSNEHVADFIREDLDSWCEYLLLAHISKENNRPELALTASLAALDERGNRETRILPTSQDEPGPVIEVE